MTDKEIETFKKNKLKAARVITYILGLTLVQMWAFIAYRLLLY